LMAAVPIMLRGKLTNTINPICSCITVVHTDTKAGRMWKSGRYSVTRAG
jgi:hypothetical protein